jgi:protocatechuate 3,4-dioxygenase beta subunit
MRDLTATNITETVLETFASCQDARYKQIITTVVRHLHDCVRELKLTPEEWLGAIKFLTDVGQTCTPQRQEFILLSDTLGVSALVNILNNQNTDSTTSSLLGPFFRENAPELKPGDTIAPRDQGEAIVMTGRVCEKGGKAIGNALIDVWQTGSDGLYDIQGDKPQEMDLRARFRTDKDGRYSFRTVLPIGYGIPMDGPVGGMLTAGGRHGERPAHIHFLLSAPGYRELATALYIAGDKNIASDAVFGVSGALVVAPQPATNESQGLRRIVYDFVMAGGARDGSSRVGSDPAALVAH